MSINLTDCEKKAIASLNQREFEDLIDRALEEGGLNCISNLLVTDCGPFMTQRYFSFGRSLEEYSKSKSSKKIERTYADAKKQAQNLSRALSDLKLRMEAETREAELFYVEDNIAHPFSFWEDLQVRVAYRWRKSTEDSWKSGSIIFKHRSKEGCELSRSRSTRKISKSKKEQERQNQL